MMEQGNRDRGFAAEPLSLYHIRQVKIKYSKGQYCSEAVSCFCGSTESIPVVEKDRYGFDHRIVLCKHCGLLYANPRMTENTAADFYARHYRPIYDDGEPDTQFNFQASVDRGQGLAGFLDENLDIQPKVVFDLGCNSGGWLKPFQDKGAEVLGVDYGHDRIAYGQQQGLPIAVGSIEDLERAGKKADLVILCHLLEHVLDLEGTLLRVRNLLTDEGVVFVRVPGLYTWDMDVLFQNAHPWQFCADTLTYVMECCGFEERYCDQHISSVWGKSDSFRSKKSVDEISVRHIKNYLFGNKRLVPEIRTVNKFPIKQRKEHIKASLSRGLPDIDALLGKESGREAIILGGGPSADEYLDKIKSLQAEGHFLVSIERMLPWCIKNRIKPDYVIALDAHEDVLEAFTETPDVKYLLATQCPAKVFDKLAGRNVYVFNTPQHGIGVADFWHSGNYDKTTIVNAGGSVTLGAVSIAIGLGATRFHIFGFDCHVTNGGYAKGIAGVGDQNHNYEIELDGRIFLTNSPYISFAQQFFKLQELGKQLGKWDSVKIYGDSLVSALSVENIRA